MSPLRALALVLAVASPAAAFAADTTVGGRILHIAPVPGFCALDRSNTVDSAFFDMLAKMQRGYNELVDVWVDCRILARYRAGQTAEVTALHADPGAARQARPRHAGRLAACRLSRGDPPRNGRA